MTEMEEVERRWIMTTPINYRGEYDPSETYHALDVVYAGPNDVICVRANTGEEITDPQYWAVISRGRDGVTPALTVDLNSNHLLIDGKDTGVSVQGPPGGKQRSGADHDV